MADMLSQAEIDALLGGDGGSSGDAQDGAENTSSLDDDLSAEDKDILGEIGNISMGTAATTLFALLNQKVWITTPRVNILSLRELSNSYDRPCVGIKIDYKEGLIGSNILVLKDNDVKIIANLMMGGDGAVDENDELSELDLSAISEAMNQMVGSSSTSLSSMLKHKIDIATPESKLLDFKDDNFLSSFGLSPEDQHIAAIAFRMEIGTLIDSEIMQVIPLRFAKEMIESLKNELMPSAVLDSVVETPSNSQSPPPEPSPVQQQPVMQPPPPVQPQPMMQPQQPMMQPQQPMMQPQYDYSMMAQPGYPQQMPMGMAPQPQQQNINVQPVQFQNFDVTSVIQQKENIGIIMDVPLEVTVELGRTHKLIKDILEFSPGTIIELDKLAGEPIDILVNGKFVAKGEVVVIDENFGIRITDIISVENRI